MDYSAIIKEIGRGKEGARDISLEQARVLFGAMLDGQIPPLQLGAVLIAFRVKGESRDELRGFMLALEPRTAAIRPPHARCAPVVIPTYNGARNAPNLVPLLALGLRARGIPVLVHGVTRDPRRVATADVLAALGISACADAAEAERRLSDEGLAFVTVGALCPGLDRLLEIRWQLGVRNTAHTACKMVQPIAGGALQLLSVTHPDYLRGMHEYYTAFPANVLLMRGTEGEAVASTRRPQALEWLHGGQCETVVAAVEGAVILPEFPAAIDAATTAAWIRSALASGQVPDPITKQIDAIQRIVGG
jgi:anthranilate phosphoribosyltransferase